MDKVEQSFLPIPELTVDDLLRFLKKLKRIRNCWIWQAGLQDGYGYFGYANQYALTHRISWRIFKKEDPGPKRVLHTCNNRACVNPDHLFLGSHSENMCQRFRDKTLDFHGELGPNAKLRECDVVEIRRLHCVGVTACKIHEKFSWVTKAAIADVLSRRSWKHV